MAPRDQIKGQILHFLDVPKKDWDANQEARAHRAT